MNTWIFFKFERYAIYLFQILLNFVRGSYLKLVLLFPRFGSKWSPMHGRIRISLIKLF